MTDALCAKYFLYRPLRCEFEYGPPVNTRSSSPTPAHRQNHTSRTTPAERVRARESLHKRKKAFKRKKATPLSMLQRGGVAFSSTPIAAHGRTSAGQNHRRSGAQSLRGRSTSQITTRSPVVGLEGPLVHCPVASFEWRMGVEETHSSRYVPAVTPLCQKYMLEGPSFAIHPSQFDIRTSQLPSPSSCGGRPAYRRHRASAAGRGRFGPCSGRRRGGA